MPVSIVWLNIDGERTAQSLEEALPNLENAEGEVLLDFSAVRRVNVSALRALEKLAAAADEKAVRVVLRGVGIDVYKVLKLMNLAPRFSFSALT